MSNPSRILIADDDPDSRLLMDATLRAEGFEVDAVPTGNEALMRCRAGHYDLVMLDVDMPGLSGHAVCSGLRAEFGELLPIVMVTGMDDVNSVDAAYRAGATDFISKPINWPLVAHRVRYLLRSAKIARDLQTAEKRIRRLAYFDSLTGLPNREHFRRRLVDTFARAELDGGRFALLCIDLDNFKRINDTLGHGLGDSLLCAVAGRLREALRDSDIIGLRDAKGGSTDEDLCRLGGDEFMVLLPVIGDERRAELVAARLARSIMRPMRLGKHEVLVTPSTGISVYPDDARDQETLFRTADMAMYFAKRQGPGRVIRFDATMNQGALNRLAIEEHLREAVARDEFSLHYQPLFNLASGSVCGLEALLRWNNPVLGLVPPAEFIPVAEETGLITTIGHWVLRTACAQLNVWQAQGLSVDRVCVNVSALQLSQTDFVDQVRHALNESGLPAKSLEIEITESVVMQSADWMRQVLGDLKAMGISIAIDDFGTGYSNFGRLRDFPMDRLKIDRSYIENLHTSADDHALASAIITMARTLQIDVVAEGVEDVSQLLILQGERCAEAQGYLLCRPMAPVDIEHLLRRLADHADATRTQRMRRLVSG